MGQGLDFPSTLPPLRRAKSLDRRTTESVMTVRFGATTSAVNLHGITLKLQMFVSFASLLTVKTQCSSRDQKSQLLLFAQDVYGNCSFVESWTIFTLKLCVITTITQIHTVGFDTHAGVSLMLKSSCVTESCL